MGFRFPSEVIVEALRTRAEADTTGRCLRGVCPRGYADDPSMDGRVWEALHVAHALARSHEFDLVHNHLDWLPLAFAQHCQAPQLTTIHGFSGPGILPAYARAASRYVSISDADRSPALEYAATVHHGIDFDELPFDVRGGPGLVAFGRVHPDKGTHTAIEIARLAGRPLTICGIIQDERYFTECVAPHVDRDRVVFLGSVGRSIIELPSYEVAMENNARPDTDAFAKEMAALCTSGPRYYNLDVQLAVP